MTFFNDSQARLLNGRKLQYQVAGAKADEEEGFVTLVRYTPQCPQGKATALFNWKVSAMEFLAKEDAILLLLLCNATVRTVADFGGEGDSLENFFIKKRRKEAKPGNRDWGSIVIQNSRSIRDLTFWYLNPREVLGIPSIDEKPTRTNLEEVHVYSSKSWLFMDGVVSPFPNKSIRKTVSTDVLHRMESSGTNQFGGSHRMDSTRRTLSGIPVDKGMRGSSIG